MKMKILYLISRDVEELRDSQDTSCIRLGQYGVQFLTVLPHLAVVPGDESIQQEENKEERPLTLYVLKNLQLCRFIMQPARILGKYDSHKYSSQENPKMS